MEKILSITIILVSSLFLITIAIGKVPLCGSCTMDIQCGITHKCVDGICISIKNSPVKFCNIDADCIGNG